MGRPIHTLNVSLDGFMAPIRLRSTDSGTFASGVTHLGYEVA
jgi:hypothetical protein